MTLSRLFILLLGGLFVGTGLHAQVKPTQHATERIHLSFAVKASVDNFLEITVSGSSTPIHTSTLGNAGLGTWAKHAPMAFDVIPGRMYTIHLAAGATSWEQTDVRISAPPGYKVFIKSPTSGPAAPQNRTSYVATPILGATDHHYAYFLVVPDDSSRALAVAQVSAPQVRGDFLWSAGLGTSYTGEPIGSLQLRLTGIGSGIFSPDAITFDSHSNDVYVTRVGGAIRQVFTPQTFVDIHPITQLGALPGFAIDYYGASDFTGPQDGDGLYTPVGSPAVSVLVQNDYDSGAGVPRLRLERVEGTRSQVWRVKQTGTTTKSWLIEELNLNRTTNHQSSVLGNGDRQEDVTLLNASSAVVQKVRRIYRTFNGTIEELIQEIADPVGAALTTDYEYYDSGSDPAGAQGKLKSVTRPDGSWTRYEYYGDGTTGEYGRWGQLKTVSSPWLDEQATTAFDYAAERSVFQENLSSVETKVSVATIPKMISKTTTHSSWGASANSQPLRTDTVDSYTTSSTTLTTTRKVYNETAHSDYANRLYSQTNPDGSKLSAYYTTGTSSSTAVTISGWNTSVSGDAVQLTSVAGQTIDPIYVVPNRSTRRIEETISGGISYANVKTEVYTSAGTWETVGHVSARYDGGAYHIYTGDVLRNLLTSPQRVWHEGLPSYDTASDGSITHYGHDAAGRLTLKRKHDIAASGDYPAQVYLYTHTTYNAADQILTERVNTSSDPNATGPTITRTYDLAGRLVTETDAAGLVTSYAYDTANRRTTITLPGGETKIIENYRDGSTKSVTDTAGVGTHRAVMVNGDGTITTTNYTLRSSDVSAPTSAPRWSSATTDWAGRPTIEQRPAPSGTFTRQFAYDASGRLFKTTEPGLAASLISYNAFGEAYRSGLDLNANDALDEVSDDRISEKTTVYENSGGVWWLTTTGKVFGTSGSDTLTTTGVSRQRLTGYSGTFKDQIVTTDIFGNVTESVRHVDNTTRLVTDTTNLPDSSVDAITITRNGLLYSKQNAQGHITRYRYDELGRVISESDPRIDSGVATGALPQRISYDSGSRVQWRKDTAGNQTTYTYDTAGRVSVETDPLGKSIRTAYTLRGELHRQWGDSTYPVEYAYNDYGERTSLSTYRDGSSWTQTTWPGTGTADTSTWDYAAATGLLSSKTDAAAKTVSYTYNTRGLLATRAWARGVTTTYSYSSTTAEQTGITYSDSTTTPLVYTYDRMGKTSRIEDASGARTQTHCVCGKLTSETLDTDFFGGRVLTYQMDSTGTGTLGRTTGFTLSGASGTGTDTSATYGYDTYGRFEKLWLPSGSAFTYAYTANANLIASITHTDGWSETQSYETTRNTLASISGKYGAAVKAQYAYVSDSLGRRTSKVESGESYNRYQSSAISTRYSYNDRSELTEARSYYGSNPADTTYPVAARGFGYSFDHIGNRTQSAVTGLDSSDAFTTTYTANSLNQVATRSLPAASPVTGFAPASAVVTVNSQTATRQGEYFYKNVAVGSTLPFWQTIAASSDLGGSTSRGVWHPVAPHSFTYDFDGNLTQDDRWAYTWDAENRMTSMETVSAAYGAGAPRQKLTFVYDYLGRRVRKTVANWNGSMYVTAVDRKFIYDGWNLIAEHDALGSGTPAVARYAWGLDLSGTLQGGGGVGGLLAIFDVTGSTVHLPYYDGNGNVQALANAATGALTATYEYDPFGNPQRVTGTYAATNPFRFSTKYTDSETSLIYYGLRYYSPSLGRFVTRDPIEEQGGLNLYGFVSNNPITSWDYLGNLPVVTMAPFYVTATRFSSFNGFYAAANGIFKAAQATYNVMKSLQQIQRDFKCRRLQEGIDNARLAAAAYKDGNIPEGSTVMTADDLKGMDENLLKTLNGMDPSGIAISVFKTPSGGYVISFRGTESGLTVDSFRDWATNLSNGIGREAEQYVSGVRFAQGFQELFPDVNVELVGHSLGGGIAAAAGIATGYTTTTYNAAGIGEGVTERMQLHGKSAANVTNYHATADPLSVVQHSLTPLGLFMPDAAGKQSRVAGAPGFSPLDAHSIDYMISSLEDDFRKQGCNP